MMMNPLNRRKNLEREERIVLRDQRQSAAGKLLQKIPDLTSLSFAIHEARPEGWLSDTRYIWRIPLEHASALFEVSCSYAYCDGGMYDVTREVLLALGSRRVQFEGEHACRGNCGAIECTRILRYVATAVYRLKSDIEIMRKIALAEQEV